MEENPQVHPPPPPSILRNHNFPPGAFYLIPPITLTPFQLGTKEAYRVTG